MGELIQEPSRSAAGCEEIPAESGRRRGFRGEFEGTPRTRMWSADPNSRLATRPTGYGQGRTSDEKPDSYGQGEGVDEDSPDRGTDDTRPTTSRSDKPVSGAHRRHACGDGDRWS